MDEIAAAELAQSPPGGATTRQSPRCQVTSIRVTARTVAPPVPGPSVTTSTVAICRQPGWEHRGARERTDAFKLRFDRQDNRNREI
jgi:hypothetical protein